MKKRILSGILAGFFMMIAMILFNIVLGKTLPSLMNQYNNTNLYRSMKDPISMLFIFYPFILGMILAWIWDKAKILLKGKRFLSKGIQFGLVYFIVVIPGLFISYITSPYSISIVISWAASVFLLAIVAGITYEKINP